MPRGIIQPLPVYFGIGKPFDTGFDVEETLSRESSERGLGLSSMRERVELTGGFFSIESNKGSGTLIRATWPIE